MKGSGSNDKSSQVSSQVKLQAISSFWSSSSSEFEVKSLKVVKVEYKVY